MNLLRLLRLLVALPGRALIISINELKRSGGEPPLGRFLRGCVHGLVWTVALMAFSMATAPPPPPAASVPVIRETPRYVPPPTPTEVLLPPSTPASTPVDDTVYVPLPDDDDDGESRFCGRRWWC